MKSLLICTFLFLVIFSKAQMVEGRIKEGVRKVNVSLAARIQLSDSLMFRHYETYSDDSGSFLFYHIDAGHYFVKIVSEDGKDTILQRVIIKSDTLLTFYFQRSCKYDESINNKTCPVCKKSNKVIPIFYGMLIGIKEDPMKYEGKKFISAGCSVTNCDPHWYCKRDKTRF